MTVLSVRLIEYIVLAVAFGGMAIDLGLGFWRDYGAPWNRRSGTNGRWRTDALVFVLVAALAAIFAVAATANGGAFRFVGWRSERPVITILLGVLAMTVVGLWLSGRVERRMAEVRGEVAAARTERAAEMAIVASDDTRRSAHRTEEAAEKVIERMDDRETRADERADDRETRAAEREERSEARETVSRQREERMVDRDRAATDGGIGNRPD